MLTNNAEKARAIVSEVVPTLSTDRFPCPHGCRTALDSALVTAPSAQDANLTNRLDVLLRRKNDPVK